MTARWEPSIVVAFWLPDGISGQGARFLADACKELMLTFFDILPPSWVIAVYPDVPESRLLVRELVYRILGTAQRQPEFELVGMGIGVQAGKVLMDVGDRKSSTTRPVGSPMSQAMGKAQSAQGCVGVEDLEETGRE